MNFKQWLEDIGSVPTGAEPGTAGGMGSAGLISGAGGGSGGFDNFGMEIRLPTKKRKPKPLGNLGFKYLSDNRPPRDNMELINIGMNGGGSGSFA